MKWLAANDRIVGRALDYGAGKGYDADAYGMESYDPHYQPDMPDGLFDTITTNYVLNVIESKEERLRVLRVIQCRLEDTGKAYVTVRNDKRALRGTTSKGTWQGHIVLRLPVVRSTAGFVTYVMDRNDGISEAILEARTYEN
jgi:hypothetical protein